MEAAAQLPPVPDNEPTFDWVEPLPPVKKAQKSSKKEAKASAQLIGRRLQAKGGGDNGGTATDPAAEVADPAAEAVEAVNVEDQEAPEDPEAPENPEEEAPVNLTGRHDSGVIYPRFACFCNICSWHHLPLCTFNCLICRLRLTGWYPTQFWSARPAFACMFIADAWHDKPLMTHL